MVQGITGSEGRKHTALMLKAGTKIVAGVNSRKAGTSVNHGDVQIPVYATVSAAMHRTGAIASAVFVPPAFAKDAVIEAIEAGIELLVTPTISRGSRHSGTGHQDDRRSHRRMWSRVVP